MLTISEQPPASESETDASPAPDMSLGNVTKVAIVEDDPAIRKGWLNILKRWPGYEPTGDFKTGEEALEKIPLNPPDFVLMDINLPGMSGIECTRELISILPDVHVIMLTMFGDWDRIFDALRAGATGYLLKRVRPAALKAALEDARVGGSPMTPHIARLVVKYFHGAPLLKKKEESRGNLEVLSPKEGDVMRLLSEGCPYIEIADKLEISVDTVRTHIRRIYQKLQVHSRTAAVVKYLTAKNS